MSEPAAGGTHGCSSWAAHIWAAARRRWGRLACSPQPATPPAGALRARGALRSVRTGEGGRSLLPWGVAAILPYLSGLGGGGRAGPAPSFPPSLPASRCRRLERAEPPRPIGSGHHMRRGRAGAGAGLGWAGHGGALPRRAHGSSATPSQPRAPPDTAEGTAPAPPAITPAAPAMRSSRRAGTCAGR